MKAYSIKPIKKRELSRREFLRCVGVTLLTTGVVLSPSLGYALYTSQEQESELKEITSDDLSKYMYIEYKTNDNNYSYMFINNNNTLKLNEEGLITEEKISDEIEQDNIITYLPATEVVEKHLGIKDNYSTDDFKLLFAELDKEVKENDQIKVKTKTN